MKEDIRKRWIERLRNTPEDEHGQGKLKDASGKMCCLGVLCEMAVEDGVIPKPVLFAVSDYHSYGAPDNVSGTALPLAVREWAGLKEETYIYGADSDNEDVIALNDIENYTFEQIATVIEENDEYRTEV